MAIKYTAEFLAHAHSLMDGKRTLGQVAKMLGAHADHLSQLLRSNGYAIIKGSPEHPTRKKLPTDELIAKYLSGQAVLSLAEEYGVSRIVITRRLRENNIKPRTQSEQNIISAQLSGPEARQKRAEAAHAAVRGKKRTHEELVRRAVIKSMLPHWIGIGENDLAQHLSNLGIEAIPQKPCGIYNIDIASGNVAVELKSGAASVGLTMHDQQAGKIKYLIESGYRVLYICFQTHDALIAALDEIVSEIDILRSDPPSPGKYRVIGCRLQDYAIVRNERHQFARVPAAVQLHTTVRDMNA